MAIDGNQWHSITINGTRRQSMAIKRPRSPIDQKAHRLCQSMAINGDQWQSKAHRLCRVSWEGADVALSAAAAAAAAAVAAAAGCTTGAMAAAHHAEIGDHLPYKGGAPRRE
jgi:hypothetical protein